MIWYNLKLVSELICQECEVWLALPICQASSSARVEGISWHSVAIATAIAYGRVQGRSISAGFCPVLGSISFLQSPLSLQTARPCPQSLYGAK